VTPELEKRLRLFIDFPSPAGVAAQVIDLANDSKADFARIAQVIGQDPALSIKVLRTANSAFYGGRRKSQNLPQAIMVLGLNATLTIALGFSLMRTFERDTKQGIDYPCFWRRALLSATAARALAEVKHLPDAEEMFLAALLQDIGILAIDRSHEDFYRGLPQSAGHHELSAFERARLGCDHAEVGAWLLRSWNIPALLCDAVEASHQLPPLSLQADREAFTEGVALSGVLADGLTRGEDGAPPCPLSEPETEPSLLDEIALGEIVAKLKERVPETEVLFGQEIMAPWELDALMGRAREALLMRNLDTLKRFEDLADAYCDLSARTEELTRVAALDSLTNVFNRRYFEEQLQALFAEACASDWPLSLLFADLDRFKQVNDAHGHQAGDDVLRTVADFLKGQLRDGDLLARYGGEEFVVLLPGVNSKDASRVAGRIATMFRARPHPVGARRVWITLSIGVATRDAEHPFADAMELLQAADRAVYAAKHRGRNRVVTFQESVLA
jgi:diguanylate cyclase (GGDEF)-like protein